MQGAKTVSIIEDIVKKGKEKRYKKK